jgi:hypothetical protein
MNLILRNMLETEGLVLEVARMIFGKGQLNTLPPRKNVWLSIGK